MNSPHGGTDRTLNQGMLMKAALATVKPLGMDEIPNLLSIMDGFVGTDLWIGDLLTLAASVYTIDPGPMPTATPQDFIDAGHTSANGIVDSHGPYNQNDGTLPNVVMKGCLYSPDNVTFGYKLQPQQDCHLGGPPGRCAGRQAVDLRRQLLIGTGSLRSRHRRAGLRYVRDPARHHRPIRDPRRGRAARRLGV